jgi:hypothetical protein
MKSSNNINFGNHGNLAVSGKLKNERNLVTKVTIEIIDAPFNLVTKL